MKTILVREPGDKTITRSELSRLSFCNSKNLPRRAIIDGQLKQWVGIGWIPRDNSEATGDEPFMIEDDEAKKPKKKPAAKTKKSKSTRSRT